MWRCVDKRKKKNKKKKQKKKKKGKRFIHFLFFFYFLNIVRADIWRKPQLAKVLEITFSYLFRVSWACKTSFHLRDIVVHCTQFVDNSPAPCLILNHFFFFVLVFVLAAHTSAVAIRRACCWPWLSSASVLLETEQKNKWALLLVSYLFSEFDSQ